MSRLEDRLKKGEQRREEDALRFRDLPEDTCQLCQIAGPDKRSLFIDCWYAIHEAVPEAIDLSRVDPKPERGQGYYLLLCKGCRGRLLTKLAEWREECLGLRGQELDEDGNLLPGEGEVVPVRIHGAIRHMTPEVYARWRAEKDLEHGEL